MEGSRAQVTVAPFVMTTCNTSQEPVEIGAYGGTRNEDVMSLSRDLEDILGSCPCCLVEGLFSRHPSGRRAGA